MQPPATPPDEEQRLRALRGLGIVGTPAEERFDRFTRIARRMFDVPVALVSLVDQDRQFFKSAQGLEAREMPRETSFCGHAILEPDMLVVEDAKGDRRFADNPLVTDTPHIGFYAGVPVRTAEGYAVGTVCLIDHRARSFGDAERRLLQDVARLVEEEFTAQRAASTDELTGISNRRGFRAIAGHTMDLGRRLGAALSLLLFDLDGFKGINDRFGHAEGDRALRDFARALLATFRSADALGRLGGDEFVVLALGAAETLGAPLARLEEHLEVLDGRPYRVRFSVGRVDFDPARHADVDALLADADARMYEEKRARGEGRE